MISFCPVALTETTIATPADTQILRIPQSWKQLESEMQEKFHIISIINNFLRKSGGCGTQPPGSAVPGMGVEGVTKFQKVPNIEHIGANRKYFINLSHWKSCIHC